MRGFLIYLIFCKKINTMLLYFVINNKGVFMQIKTEVKGDIFQMKMEKVRVKEENGFDLQLNREYKIYQEDNLEKLLTEKVNKELSLKKLKQKLSLIFYPCVFFTLYSLFTNNISIFTLFAFILFVGSYFFYTVNKIKIKDVTKIKNIAEMKRINNNSFLDSFASEELLNVYREVYGEEKYEDLLFQNGSDEKTIKIKQLIN